MEYTDKLIKFNQQIVYVHTFRLISPRRSKESLKYNMISSLDELDTVAEKIRYYRYMKGIKQSDVADYIGINRSSYTEYEILTRDYYSPQIIDMISEILGVDSEMLLDEYNKFQYKGQGAYISTFRKKLKITQADLAKKMGVNLSKVKRWEQNRTRMYKSTWEKLKDLK